METTTLMQGSRSDNVGVLPAFKFEPSAAVVAVTSSNTNSNANSDVAGVDQLLQDTANSITMEDHGSPLSEDGSSSSGSSHSVSSSPGSSYQTESYGRDYSSHLPQIKTPTVMSASQGLLSPIAGDVPMITQVSSPSLPQFEFASVEQSSDGGATDPHSPNAPSAAKLHTILKQTNEGKAMITTFSESLSPVTVTSIIHPTITSPTHSFAHQQGVVFDHRNDLGVASSILFQPNLTTLSTATLPPDDENMEESKLHVCLWDNCGHEFPTLASLVAHLDRGHTISMSKYICLWKDCTRNQKPFDARYKLITHLRCHTGEKPYRCEVPTCNRSFSRLENLKLHVRTHTGEKPYECHYDGCTKKFNNTSDRAKHMKTHITRKPYACKYPGCGKSYTDPSSMRKHIKYTHKMKERKELDQNQATLVKVSGDVALRKGALNSTLTCSSPSSSSHLTKTVIFGKQQTTLPAVTLSPVGSSMPIDTRLLHSLQSSPPPPSTMSTPMASSHMINGGTPIVAIANQQQAQLIPVPLVQLPSTGQGSKAKPVSLIQQSPQPVLVATGPSASSQQPLLMVFAGSGGTSGVTTKGGQVLEQSNLSGHTVTCLGSPQNVSMAEQSSGEAVKTNELKKAVSGEAIESMLNGQPSSEASNQQQNNVEAQLRLQIAHLQQQLYHSQAQAQMLAMQQQNQNKNCGKIIDDQTKYVQLQVSSPDLLLPTSLMAGSKGASPTKVAMVTTTATQSSIPIPCFTPVISPPQLATTQQQQQQNTNKQQPTTASAAPPILVTNSLQTIMNPGQPVMHPFMFPHGAHVIPVLQSQDVSSGQYLCMTPNP